MLILIEQNSFYSNYLRCQLLGKHLPFEVVFDEFDPEKAKKADIVLFQSLYLYKSFVQGPKYIWDLDDLIENDELYSKDKIKELEIEIQKCFVWCDGVIFGSDRLYDHYKKWYTGEYMIMDDYIDPCDHEATNELKDDGKIRIGFMGSGMYKREVEELIPIMQELKKKYPIEFIVIGVNAAGEKLKKAGFKLVPFNKNYNEFQYLLTNEHLDIAVIYQKERDVMIAKNYLKFAEFSWFGIPVVASEWITGRYVPKTLYKPFTDLKSCSRALEGLILDKDRTKLGKNAQKFTKTHFSLHDRTNQYKKFFEGVL